MGFVYILAILPTNPTVHIFLVTVWQQFSKIYAKTKLPGRCELAAELLLGRSKSCNFVTREVLNVVQTALVVAVSMRVFFIRLFSALLF